MPPAARIADGGDVIDVDAETDGWSSHGQPFTRSTFATTRFSRICAIIAVKCLRS
jgi:hypothetical protein